MPCDLYSFLEGWKGNCFFLSFLSFLLLSDTASSSASEKITNELGGGITDGQSSSLCREVFSSSSDSEEEAILMID